MASTVSRSQSSRASFGCAWKRNFDEQLWHKIESLYFYLLQGYLWQCAYIHIWKKGNSFEESERSKQQKYKLL